MNNTIKTKCRVCHRPFTKRTKSTGHALKYGVRPANAVTCGRKECARKNLSILAHKVYMKNKDRYKARCTPEYQRNLYIYRKDEQNKRRREKYAAMKLKREEIK